MSGITGSSSRGENTNDNWQTPLHLVEKVRLFAESLDFDGVTLDPATTKKNPMHAEYIRTPDCDPDGLETAWFEQSLTGNHRFVYVNPPYRGAWWKKIALEAGIRPDGSHMLVLLPAKPGTGYFSDLASKAQGLVFVRGRLTFNDPATGEPRFNEKTGQPDPATFESALMYFGGERYAFLNAFANMGWAV